MPVFVQSQCAYCREEKLPACRKQNPKWFIGEEEHAGHDITIGYYDKVHAWVGKNTKTVPCVVFDPGDENEAYCMEHLKVVLKELRNYMNGKEMS